MRPRTAALLIAGLVGLAACTVDTGPYGYRTGYGYGTGTPSGYGYDAGLPYVAPSAYGYYGGGYVGVPAYGYGGYGGLGWHQDSERGWQQRAWQNGGAERFGHEQQNPALVRQQALQNQAFVQQNQSQQQMRYNQQMQGQAIARYNQQVQENQAIRVRSTPGHPPTAADRQ
jgi:hypothetical protein